MASSCSFIFVKHFIRKRRCFYFGALRAELFAVCIFRKLVGDTDCQQVREGSDFKIFRVLIVLSGKKNLQKISENFCAMWPYGNIFQKFL